MADSIRFYTDEQVARAVVDGLRRRGVSVLTCQEAGLLATPDEYHLAFATDQKCVIFSQDDDFLRLHARGISHAELCMPISVLQLA